MGTSGVERLRGGRPAALSEGPQSASQSGERAMELGGLEPPTS